MYNRITHRHRPWGSPGTCPQIIEKHPCIYHFLPPFAAPQYFGLPTQYLSQVYANGITYNCISKERSYSPALYQIKSAIAKLLVLFRCQYLGRSNRGDSVWLRLPSVMIADVWWRG